MKSEIAFCSGCGHQVRLTFTDPPPRDGHANLKDEAEIVLSPLVSANRSG